MNWLNALMVVFEAKKQYIIVTIIIVIISSIGGFYAMSNRGDNTNSPPGEDIIINVNPSPDEEQKNINSAELRKGEFKKSKKVTW